MRKASLYLIQLLLLLCIAGSCQKGKKDFTHFGDLKNYLAKVHGVEMPENESIIFLLQLDMCGACTEQNKLHAVKFLRENSGKKYIILSRQDNDLASFFLQHLGEHAVNILQDDGLEIERYGLRFAKDLMLVLDQGQIQDWSYLTSD